MRKILGLLAAMTLLLPLLLLDAERPATAAGGCPSGLVALTFDDGPARGTTASLVRVLRGRHVPATFFMVGGRVATAPEAARLVSRSGFVIGNHTWNHPRLTRLSNAGIRSELASTARRMRSLGLRVSPLMRPPYGLMDARVRRVVTQMGYRPVLWTAHAADWDPVGSGTIARRVLRQLRPNARNVILLHDGVRNSPNTVRAVPTIVDRARARGFCFAALDGNGTPVRR